MEKKFLAFLEVAKVLNKHGVTPILYGSLGLYRIISPVDEVGDIDIAVPDVYIKQKFSELKSTMAEIGYRQDSVFPHEFVREKIRVGFEPESEFRDYKNVNPANFEIVQWEDAQFKEISPRDYLTIYKKNLEIREKKVASMKTKISALELFLEKK